MGEITSYLDGLRDPRLAPYAFSTVPAWLWSVDGTRVLWTNAQGAALFGADPMVLVERRLEATEPLPMQIAGIVSRLPERGARLERLSGIDADTAPVACHCARMLLSDSTEAVLMVATEPVRGALPLRERVRSVVASCAEAVAVFALDGSLICTSEAARRRLGNEPNLATLGFDALARAACETGAASAFTPHGRILLERIGSATESVFALTLAEPAAVSAATSVHGLVDLALTQALALTGTALPSGADARPVLRPPATAAMASGREDMSPPSAPPPTEPDRTSPAAPGGDNVVRFPTSASSSGQEAPVLSPHERIAFSELARRLTARLTGEDEHASERPAGAAEAERTASRERDPTRGDPIEADAHPRPPADMSAIPAEALAAIGQELQARMAAVSDLARTALASSEESTDGLRHRLRAIRAHADLVAAQFEDYLLLADIRSGGVMPIPEPCDLNALVHACTSHLRTASVEERIVIRLSLGVDLPQVVVDRRLAARIVSNLLASAAEATPVGGQIIVSTLSQERSVVLRVRSGGERSAALQDALSLGPAAPHDSTAAPAHRIAQALARAAALSVSVTGTAAAGTLVEIEFPAAR